MKKKICQICGKEDPSTKWRITKAECVSKAPDGTPDRRKQKKDLLVFICDHCENVETQTK